MARTLSEAMAQVKAELGPEAVILHTSEVKVGGFFGLFGTRMIEVTAAADHSDPRPAFRPQEQGTQAGSAPGLKPLGLPTNAARPTANGAGHPAELILPGRPSGGGSAQAVAPPVQAGAPPARTSPTPAPSTVQAGPVPAPVSPPGEEVAAAAVAAVRREMMSMKAMLGNVLERFSGAPAARLVPELQDLYSQLVGGGILDEMAMQVVERVRSASPNGALSGSEALSAARQLLAADLGPGRTVEVPQQGRRIIALVGPTGVGKTTTLAKLAAHYSLGRRLRVALITADTYRIAAVEQLRTYSEILGIPLEVVYDAKEIAPAVAKHLNRDLILVDTAGRSPRNEGHMRELQSCLQVLSADETYLVISMTSSFRDATAIVESYMPIGFQRFIFTKWDEAEAPGLIYNMVAKYRVPLSYITTGQNVPDDIEVADPHKITRAILGD